jgi:crotonobetainyl-CoA:carnitine CoA-transferase CaiB-like acyl-CoA transferase
MTNKGALSGLRVIDATQYLAGPICGKTLGDLGADVIKVESLLSGGEYNRTHGIMDLQSNGEMCTFLALNRNKRSLPVDLKNPAGVQVIHDLVAKSDIFLQNFRFGTADRLGIGYEELSKINPKLIYCSITGYGTTGPLRDRPGQDLILQGYSGSMFSVGALEDDPAPSALWAPDVMTGYQAAIGILAAVQARTHTGKGQHVEIDMLSVVLDCQLQELVTYLNTGVKPRRTSERSAHGSIPAPYGIVKTSDSWLVLSMIPLPTLGEILNNDWLRGLDQSNDGQTYRDEVYRAVRHQFTNKTTAEWVEIFDAAGAWCGPVYDYDDLVQDAHIIENNYIVDQPQYRGGSARTVRPTIKMSDTPTSIRSGAPALGEHSEEIMRDILEYDEGQISSLFASSVVGNFQD